MDAKDKGAEAGTDSKRITITVNGREREYEREQVIDFHGVVKLAFPKDNERDTTIYSVSYSGPRGTEGALVEGDKVRVKAGMLFNVRRTDRS